ncbi:synaptonemal complex protein 2 [Acanthochromis polyacanthus]|uniref:synaptonemal complex protein 2 n=1 Tax=Acanthochromis polyacanthus TaxID=80966 RepID=UPI002234C1B2|nr:synaptonemal complex protein 2 [Acanthochromis polyacanthus]
MIPHQSNQLENAIDEGLKSGNAQALQIFLQRDIYEEIPMKCSQQFLTKLDKLVNRCLAQRDVTSASLGLASLSKCGKNLKLPGDQGLSGLIAQGLIKKMLQWFEKCRQLWIRCGLQWDETLFTLSEDFLNALTVVHEACKEGTWEVTECFLYPIGQLVVDPRIYILIKKEAIRKFNLILDKIPVELKKDRKILTSQESSDLMIKLASQILDGGDYDFQSSLMEALCRMATPHQRREQADQWFSMGHVASAFAKIHDSEFETACRKFLNMVNGMQGDRRRVHSYPCLEVYLGKHELLMPSDENLEEFWIDFNLGSHSISFYFSLTDEETQEGHWDTICINENEVQSYTVTVAGKRQVLQVKLSEVVVVGSVEGSSLTIHFSSALDIQQAARNVYGLKTNKGTSVSKTTIKTRTEVNSTQVVPESQVSLGESERSTVPYLLPPPATHVQTVTPAKSRISESATLVCCSAVGSAHSSSSVAVWPANTPAKRKDKSSQEMGRLREAAVKTCSHNSKLGRANAVGVEEKLDTPQQSKASKQGVRNKTGKYKKNISVAEAVDLVLSEQGEDKCLEPSFVPDTQPRKERNIWKKLSVSEMLLMPSKKSSPLPQPEPHSNVVEKQDQRPSSAQRWSVSNSALVRQKELHMELTKRLQQVLDERSQNPKPQEPAALERKSSNVRGDSKDKSSGDKRISSLCSPEVQQTPRNSSAKGKSKSQTSLKPDAVTVKAKERISTKLEVETKRTSSSKDKRDAEVAGSMVKLISSRYERKTRSTGKDTAETVRQSWSRPLVSRPIFNMSWLPTANRDTPGAVRKINSVFEFSTDASLSIGGENKTQTNTSAMSSSDIHNSSLLLNTNKKGQPVAKNKRYVKKHLFSDTDTDYAQTEVSWLRESSRKPKPKVTKYSRQAPIKAKPVPLHTSHESPKSFQPSPKTVTNNTKPSKKPDWKTSLDKPKKTVKPAAAAPSRPHAAGKRPRRAAAISTKSYRVPDTDDSQSEPEKPPSPKAKDYFFSSTNHLKNNEETHEAAQMKTKRTTSKQPNKSYVKLVTECVSEKEPPSKKYFVGQKGKSEKTWSEVPQVKKRKNTLPEQSADGYTRQDSNKQSDLKKTSGLKLRPDNVLQETSKLNKKNIIPAQEQMSALKDSWASCQTSFCPSPPFIEKMRSHGRSDPTLDLTCSPVLSPQGSPLPASPNPLCQDTPSPIPLLPKPRSTASSKGACEPSSFYSAEKKRSRSKTLSIQPVHSLSSRGGQTFAPSPPSKPGAAEVCAVTTHLSSAPQSPLSLSTQFLMTSTLLDLDKPPVPSPAQSPLPEESVNYGHHSGFSKVSSASLASTSRSSAKSLAVTSRVKDSSTGSLTVSLKTEKTPRSYPDLQHAQLISGPSRKRHISSSSDSEEGEREERKKSKMREQASVRMKPRKLFKSLAEVSCVDELSQVMSYSPMSSSHWEAEVVDRDMDMDEDLELPESSLNPSDLCQKLSSELNKKFQNRYKVEVYNKQSLKTLQQHVSSINKQVNKRRTERLGHLQNVLFEEIRKLEQEDTLLKSMEKDLAVYWKKQTLAFHSYQEQETKRNETMKRALQSDTCPSLEYEERIFTSQMCLIRKGMKSAQDRLLSEMLEGEIQSVKRGLHALFFP